jgi:hypothetical protein
MNKELLMRKILLIILLSNLLLTGCKSLRPYYPVKPVTRHYRGSGDIAVSYFGLGSPGMQIEVGNAFTDNVAMAISFMNKDDKDDEDQIIEQNSFEVGPEFYFKGKHAYFMFGASYSTGDYYCDSNNGIDTWYIDNKFNYYSAYCVGSINLAFLRTGIGYKTGYLDFTEFELRRYKEDFDYSDPNTTIRSATIFAQIMIKQIELELGISGAGATNNFYGIESPTAHIGFTYHFDTKKWFEDDDE